MIRTIEHPSVLKARYALAVLAYYSRGPFLFYKDPPLKTKVRALINHDRVLTDRPRIQY